MNEPEAVAPPVPCPACQGTAPPGASFCPWCGGPVAPGAKRSKQSQTTIVAIVIAVGLAMIAGMVFGGVWASKYMAQAFTAWGNTLSTMTSPGAMGGTQEEQKLRVALDEMRAALLDFREDTGCWPEQLGDLLRPSDDPPTSGRSSDDEKVPIKSETYQGPYLAGDDGQLPLDPMTESRDTWQYRIDAELGLADVHSGSEDRSWDGTPYSEW